MTKKENPTILRENIVKIWKNNLYLKNTIPQQTPSFFLFYLILVYQIFLKARYLHVVNFVFYKNDSYLEIYQNIYKYKKNYLLRPKKEQILFDKRFNLIEKKKYKLKKKILRVIFQNILTTQFFSILFHFYNISLNLRKPLLKKFFKKQLNIKKFANAFFKNSKSFHFVNTIQITTLLNTHRAIDLYTNHFGRELQRVTKKQHWPLIYTFLNIMKKLPSLGFIKQHEFIGFWMELSGRPKYRKRTFTLRVIEGASAVGTFRNRMAYGFGEAYAKIGVFGIKIRITY